MSAGQRLAILAVAAVVLVGGFFVAQGSSGDDDDTASTPTTTEQPATTGSSTAPTETEPQRAEPQPAPQPRVDTIRIRDNQPVGEPPTLKFENGDTIRLRFRSNVATEIHIHGFDEYVDVPAGGTATARLKADIDGIFEVEDHSSAALLAKLEIQP